MSSSLLRKRDFWSSKNCLLIYFSTYLFIAVQLKMGSIHHLFIFQSMSEIIWNEELFHGGLLRLRGIQMQSLSQVGANNADARCDDTWAKTPHCKTKLAAINSTVWLCAVLSQTTKPTSVCLRACTSHRLRAQSVWFVASTTAKQLVLIQITTKETTKTQEEKKKEKVLPWISPQTPHTPTQSGQGIRSEIAASLFVVG